MTVTLDLTEYIRDVPDFPKAGVVFKDITPLLKSEVAFAWAVERMCAPFDGRSITKVAAIESRGFIFGGAIATRLRCGFVPIRKPGKLPWATYRNEYTLEYGTDALEIHNDAFSEEDHVLIVDDVLATGGTGAAAAALLSLFQARVAGMSFVIELEFLEGRKRMGDAEIHSLIRYS